MRNVFLNVVIAILSVGLAASLVYLIIVKCFFGVSGNFETDNDMLYFDLKNGLYAECVQDCYCNKYCGITEQTQPEYTDYIEFSKYYEAAGKYRVYSGMGYRDRADAERLKMDTAKSKMTELRILTDKVDKMMQYDKKPKESAQVTGVEEIIDAETTKASDGKESQENAKGLEDEIDLMK